MKESSIKVDDKNVTVEREENNSATDRLSAYVKALNEKKEEE